MKAAVWVYTITILLLSSCFGPSGPATDEDFAGNWHTTSGNTYGMEEIIELTDTTFSVFIRYANTDNEYYRGYRGFVERRSDTSLYIKTYEVYIFEESWADPLYIYPYSHKGEYKDVDFVTGNIGTDEYPHYFNMVIDAEFSYGWSGSDLVIDGTPFSACDPISDSIPD